MQITQGTTTRAPLLTQPHSNKKKIIIIIIIVAIVIVAVALGIYFGLKSKNKHKDEPITYCTELDDFFANSNTTLTKDIDCQGKLIHMADNFTWALDGQGFSIKNVVLPIKKFEDDSLCVGMFQNLSGAMENINFENITFNETVDFASYRLGGLACFSDTASFKNVKFSGNFILSSINSIASITVGGLIGEHEGSFVADSCFVDVNISIDLTNKMFGGGLIGKGSTYDYYQYSITNVHTLGKIETGSYLQQGYLGGFASSMAGIIKNSSSSMTLVNGMYSGGLVWNLGKSIVSDSYFDGTILNCSMTTGGLAGKASLSTITNFIFNGSIIASDYSGSEIGGVFGSVSDQTGITNSKSFGVILNTDRIYQIGSFVGYSSADLIQISTSIAEIDFSAYEYAGGLIGEGKIIIIQDCYYKGNISTSNQYALSVGGLIGQADSISDVLNSFSKGKITIGSEANNVGGIVGMTYNNFTIIKSFSTMDILNGSTCIGGLIGSGGKDILKIEQSYYYGNIISEFQTGTSGFGGLVGQQMSGVVVISKSWSGGSIISNSSLAGGFLSMSMGGGNFSNSFSNMSIEGSVDVGGLLGVGISSQLKYVFNITNCYSVGKVSSQISSNTTGGLVGFDQSFITNVTVTNSYWNVETSTQKKSNGGEARTTQQMQKQNNYQNWDFNNVWQFTPDSDFPQLRESK